MKLIIFENLLPAINKCIIGIGKSFLCKYVSLKDDLKFGIQNAMQKNVSLNESSCLAVEFSANDSEVVGSNPVQC
jgi:hypothetical protein